MSIQGEQEHNVQLNAHDLPLLHACPFWSITTEPVEGQFVHTRLAPLLVCFGPLPAPTVLICVLTAGKVYVH